MNNATDHQWNGPGVERSAPPVREAPRPSLVSLVALDVFYLIFLAVPATLYTFYGMIFRGKYRRSWWGRWGVGLHRATERVRGNTIWIHAVSVGEARAAVPVVSALRQRFPDHEVVITVTTETGFDTARSLFEDCLVWWSPWDWAWNVNRWMRRLRPALIVIMEMDVWPNFTRVAAWRGIPVTAINGKLSDKSSRNYQRLTLSPFAPLVHAMWTPFQAICVQTELDRQRIAPLVRHPSMVHVTGNVKFDFPAPQISDADRQEWRKRLGLSPDQPIVIAGSTHAGEEEIILAAFRAAREQHPDAHMILVPRHPERFDDVAEVVGQAGLSMQRWSEVNGAGADVTLVDQMGLLLGLYSLSTIAIVAGSWKESVGGHNVLEPAQFGIPVVFGPHMHSQRDMRRIIKRADGGLQVNADGLAEALIRLLGDPEERRRIGEAGRRAVLSNRGSARRSVEVVGTLLPQSP